MISIAEKTLLRQNSLSKSPIKKHNMNHRLLRSDLSVHGDILVGSIFFFFFFFLLFRSPVLRAALCELCGKVALSFFPGGNTLPHTRTETDTLPPPPTALVSYWPYHCCLTELSVCSLKLTRQISDQREKGRRGSGKQLFMFLQLKNVVVRSDAAMSEHFLFHLCCS